MKRQQKAAEITATTETKAPSKTPVEIHGKTYDLCFDFHELAKAERFYQAQGRNFRLIFALPQFNLESLQVVLPCSLRTHHPELSWDQAQALVTLQSATAIALAVAGALGGGEPASSR